MKHRIKLTESDLCKIVKEAIDDIDWGEDYDADTEIKHLNQPKFHLPWEESDVDDDYSDPYEGEMVKLIHPNTPSTWDDGLTEDILKRIKRKIVKG